MSCFWLLSGHFSTCMWKKNTFLAVKNLKVVFPTCICEYHVSRLNFKICFIFFFLSRWMHCKCVKIVRLRKMWEGQRARERPRRWALAIGESVYWHNGFSVAQHCYLSHTSLTFVLYISDWVLVFLVWSNQRFCYSPYRPTNEVREIVILCRRMVLMYTWRENTQLGYTVGRLAL